jgi:sigma-E factor negative regulatory protein RseB
MALASTADMRPRATSFAAVYGQPCRRSYRPLVRGYGGAIWICGLLFVLSLFGEDAQAIDAGNDAKLWLDKIATAAQKVNYEGTFVYRRGDKLVTMHLIHVIAPNGEKEQLVSLSGGERELLRSKDGVVCLFPGKKRISFNKGGLDKHFPGQLPAHMADLEKNYRLTMGSNDRIAGRAARMIVIEPKDSYRYGYRIWVDAETGLLLQSDLVNEHGSAVEQVIFTSINVVDKATSEMLKAVTMDDDMRKSLKDSKQRTISGKDVPWRLAQMPNGFSLAEHYKHINRKGDSVEQLVLTDGMATVSIFIERLKDNATPFTGPSHMGAINAFVKVVDDHQLTVVGEVPAATVHLISDSLNIAEVAGK